MLTANTFSFLLLGLGESLLYLKRTKKALFPDTPAISIHDLEGKIDERLNVLGTPAPLFSGRQKWNYAASASFCIGVLTDEPSALFLGKKKEDDNEKSRKIRIDKKIRILNVGFVGHCDARSVELHRSQLDPRALRQTLPMRSDQQQVRAPPKQPERRLRQPYSLP
ncbi:TPA: hypothetical protein UM516_001986 [Stenotrophomonas maltophilia]|nr:hypothetical protein [Stenotrophomonas maltophilia]